MFAAVLLLATTMAIFGVLGYLKGAKWAFIALMILSAAVILVEVKPETLIATLNGLYMGVMLTLKGGLGALASGDVEEAKAILADIDKPFKDANQNMALLLVIFCAVVIGLIMAAAMKSKPGVWGLIWGLVYGYVLSAGVLPLISSNPLALLPLPIVRPAERQPAQASVAMDQMFATLAQPENVQIIATVIGIAVILLLLLTVRRGVKGSKR
ncbi:MAG TPA: hypothetical protein PKM78_03635 [Anaerolineae bacterium]|nr:hypothetical protein [Anaerolineae bacterium]HNU02980.1 hypothetical protein [Anaerolineae bacterium]